MDPLTLIETYLDRLGNNDFEAAVGFFVEDCSYIHSPMFKNDVETTGRDSLLRYFEEVRGRKDVDFTILEHVTDGQHIGFFSTAEGEVDNEYFLGYAILEDDLIETYIVGTI